MAVHNNLEPLDLRGLAEIADGAMNAEFENLSNFIGRDINARPNDDRPRTITLKVSFRPNLDSKGNLVDIKVDADMGAKTPGSRSDTYSARLHANGGLSYLPSNALNVNQPTLFDSRNNDQ